jgi:hypothetical protein
MMRMAWAGDTFGGMQAVGRLAGGEAGIIADAGLGMHALAAATDTGTAFSADQHALALATFLLKILMPGFAARDRPDRASPGKPGKPATSPPASPASLPSPTSPAESSSTDSTPGRSPKGKDIARKGVGV